MGLFQKQPITNSQPFYELSADKALLLVGLGNIGEKYVSTRHNIGFDVLDSFAQSQEFPGWVAKKNLFCELTSRNINGIKVILAKPTTFMNDSGKAVSALQSFYKIKNEETLIVADELDIKFGQIRTRVGGSAAGHKGMDSIINRCGDDFGRVRIGIGPKVPQKTKSEDFVLKKFSKEQQTSVGSLLKEAIGILGEYCYSGGKLVAETRDFLF